MAIVSLIASLSSLVIAIGFIPGIITGHMALKQIRETGEPGRGMALAGLVTGYVFAGIALIITIFVVWGVIAVASMSAY